MNDFVDFVGAKCECGKRQCGRCKCGWWGLSRRPDLATMATAVDDEEMVRIQDSHEDDGFTAAEDAVDERLEEVGDVAETRLPDDEASRQKARITHGDILSTTLYLREMLIIYPGYKRHSQRSQSSTHEQLTKKSASSSVKSPR